MPILAVYDVTGIQDYIFGSNKLSENVGASRLVADVFKVVLPDVIKCKCAGDCKVDWNEHESLSETRLGAEILYQGGGNAFVAYRDDKTFQAVTEAFLLNVAKKTRGLGVAVAAIETDLVDGYEEDFKKLNERLSIAKGSLNRPIFMGNQPITKQSTRTGNPVSYFCEEEYIDVTQKHKRDSKQTNDTLYPEGINTFEDLVGDSKNSDSFLGVVHADGNNMGVAISEYMKKFDTYATAVPAIRGLSKRIAKCYKEALDETCGSYPKPIRLITDGDDMTVVMKGRYAIPFAAELLRNIEQSKNPPIAGVKPTACAGVVLFHAHYPISNAYTLAEECCGEAKKLSRTKPPHSYIDFHLHKSGNAADLDTLRKRQYTVDGKSIICRPWSVSEGISPPYKWLEDNSGLKNWPRNKSKAFRNAIAYGDQAAQFTVDQSVSQGLKFLDFKEWEPSDKQSKFAPHFDLLEIMDIYEGDESE